MQAGQTVSQPFEWRGQKSESPAYKLLNSGYSQKPENYEKNGGKSPGKSCVKKPYSGFIAGFADRIERTWLNPVTQDSAGSLRRNGMGNEARFTGFVQFFQFNHEQILPEKMSAGKLKNIV